MFYEYKYKKLIVGLIIFFIKDCILNDCNFRTLNSCHL